MKWWKLSFEDYNLKARIEIWVFNLMNSATSRRLCSYCPSSQVSLFTHFDGFFFSDASGRHRLHVQFGWSLWPATDPKSYRSCPERASAWLSSYVLLHGRILEFLRMPPLLPGWHCCLYGYILKEISILVPLNHQLQYGKPKCSTFRQSGLCNLSSGKSSSTITSLPNCHSIDKGNFNW